MNIEKNAPIAEKNKSYEERTLGCGLNLLFFLLDVKISANNYKSDKANISA